MVCNSQILGNDASKDEVMHTIKLLSGSIDICLNFTRIDGIVSKSVSFDIFQHFGVPLYHLWIVDPQDAVIARAVGEHEHEIFRALDPFEPPVPIPNADQRVADFLQGIGLTALGLQELSNAMENDKISVVFWKKTFHTIVKRNDGLYALHNDLRSFKENVLWKELNVGGDGRLCTSTFVPVAVPVGPTTQAQEEAERELAWEKTTEDEKRKLAAVADVLRQVRKHKCLRHNCELQFHSVINLNRHKQVHRKEHKANMDSVNIDDIAKFWDELSDEDCKELLSIKDAPAIKGITGDMIYQCLEKITPKDDLYDNAYKLKFIIDCSEKVSSKDLFKALDEASEKMAFSIDLSKYSDYSIFGKELLLLPEVHDVLACGSYFLEHRLMKKWLEYNEDKALQNTVALLDEVANSRTCGKSNCSLPFSSEVNYNRHKFVHSPDFSHEEDFLLNRDDIGIFWDNLKYDEASQLLDYGDMRVESFRGKRFAKILDNVVQDSPRNAVTHIAHRLKTMLKKCEKTPSTELFDLLNKASEETLFCTDICKCKENMIFGDDAAGTLSNVLACISYMLEKKLVQRWYRFRAAKASNIEGPETSVELTEDSLESKDGHAKSVDLKEDSLESKEASIESADDIAKSRKDSVHENHDTSGLHSSDSCQRIPFKEYVKRHKITKVFKFPAKDLFKQFRKHLKKFQRTFKLYLNILTKNGRKCARGFLLYIVKMHMAKKCWNGDWDLSDMEVLDGQFIISKQPLLGLTLERVVEDLKRFTDLVLQPNYSNKKLESYPLYFDEFQKDILKCPDPNMNWKEFILFEKYLALHFAFMPPLSRSSLLVHLFKAMKFAYDEFPHSRMHSMKPKSDWRQHLKHLSYVHDIYYYGVGLDEDPDYEPYPLSYYHLLKFCRHSVSHDTDHSRLLNMILSDLILGQLLCDYIADLIWFMVKFTEMEGSYFHLFQAFEASDGDLFFCTEDEADDDISESSESSDFGDEED